MFSIKTTSKVPILYDNYRITPLCHIETPFKIIEPIVIINYIFRGLIYIIFLHPKLLRQTLQQILHT